MTGPIPDPLRRFIATPHVAVIPHPGGELRIDSNDSAFTQALSAHFCNTSPNPILDAFDHLKVIVEHSLPSEGDELTHLDAGPLRTVLRGTNTILVHDSDTHELLAFLAQGVSCDELLQRLLPAVAITNG